MNEPIHHNQVNRILLKPRFKVLISAPQQEVLRRFEYKLNLKSNQFNYKIVMYHIVLDIKKEANHFWSPQLYLEIEKNTETTSVIKCLFGPKPQVWSFFIFVHFAVALIFLVFLVIAYSKYTLNKDYTFALTICVIIPVLWILFYVFGQLGKKKAYPQMQQMHNYLMEILG